jgi:hypothetical protein
MSARSRCFDRDDRALAARLCTARGHEQQIAVRRGSAVELRSGERLELPEQLAGLAVDGVTVPPSAAR